MNVAPCQAVGRLTPDSNCSVTLERVAQCAKSTRRTTCSVVALSMETLGPRAQPTAYPAASSTGTSATSSSDWSLLSVCSSDSVAHSHVMTDGNAGGPSTQNENADEAGSGASSVNSSSPTPTSFLTTAPWTEASSTACGESNDRRTARPASHIPGFTVTVPW